MGCSDAQGSARPEALQEPFGAVAVKAACPGWADATYRRFLLKHAEGNGTQTELFVRVARDSYRLRAAVALLGTMI
jgi:hypothetical protein